MSERLIRMIEQTILKFFEAIPHVVCLYIFGSFARNSANERSDVDIAVLFEKSNVPTPLTLIGWREDLAALLHREVDLVCLNSASPIIGMQVYKESKIILMKNSKEHARYQMALFSDYAELKELRAPMEKDILKRKFYD